MDFVRISRQIKWKEKIEIVDTVSRSIETLISKLELKFVRVFIYKYRFFFVFFQRSFHCLIKNNISLLLTFCHNIFFFSFCYLFYISRLFQFTLFMEKEVNYKYFFFCLIMVASFLFFFHFDDESKCL